MVNAGASSDGGESSGGAVAAAPQSAKSVVNTAGPPSSTGGDDVDPDDSTATTAGGQKKRKKAVRACNHCQTAHLTCDDNRPCLRCVKRGLGDTCQDGARKKAKYLRDIEDALVNAGKANPTHFIHSPPAGQDAGSGNKESTSAAAATAATTTATATGGASTKQQNSKSKQSKPKPQQQRQASDTDHKPRVSPSLLSHEQPSTISIDQQQQQPTTNVSPLHYTPASLPPPPLSTSSLSQAGDLPSALTVQDNNGNNNNATQLPPNATQSYSNLLANYDPLSNNNHTGISNNNNNANDHLQPFNFFNDLNGAGGNGGGAPDFGFSNNSANLEYAVLSSMIQNSGYGNTSPMGFHNDLGGGGTQQHNPIYQSIFTGNGDYGQVSYGFPPAAFENNTSSNSNNNRASSNSGHETTNTNYLNLNQANPSPSSNNTSSYLQNNQQSNNSNNNVPSLQAPTNTFGALPIDHNWPTIASKMPNGSDNSLQQGQHQQQHQQHQHQHQQGQGHHLHHQSQNQGVHQSQSQLSPNYTQQSNMASTRTKSKPTISSTGVMKVEDVYKHINKPYNYLEAYHALIRYLQSHFKNKANVLRIIRALSIYRPSIIALHMPLTLEDEIFVERSFQRTLIELEKLISFSGTPTLVWRRTGEIVLVGTEFTLLSEWRREDLLSRDRTLAGEAGELGDTVPDKKSSKGKRRYIFEVFDQDSLVEYYETFAQHAFESSSTTIMFTCSIVTPKGRKVPCTFGYNLKRDIFGLPQMVIGQFLPILTSPDDPTT